MKGQFSFDLPQELIAQYPARRRDGARLLVVYRDTGALVDTHIAELPSLLPAPSMLIFNDSRVRAARLKGRKESTGSDVEILLVNPVEADASLDMDKPAADWYVYMRHLRRQKPGQRYLFPANVAAEFRGIGNEQAHLHFTPPIGEKYLRRHGMMPIPPYLNRSAQQIDTRRYQTIYAAHSGSVAAPTAGLHFTPRLLRHLTAHNIAMGYITLHVGPGTFMPVRTEDISMHHMHEEHFFITEQLAGQIAEARRKDHPIVAVGTTTVRALEAAWTGEMLPHGSHATDIFIYPPYRFGIIDAMLTNFHLPDSTLIMLVAAFAGYDTIMRAYHHAVEQRYRFFSYGDAMLIL